MNLIVDIGNTSAKMVAFKGDTIIEEVKVSNTDLESLAVFFNKYPFKRGIASSVIGFTPNINKELDRLNIPILRLSSSTPTPLVNDYRTPETLGTDRLAAAVGAYTRFPNHDILIIDAGTCITYEFVNKAGHYKGGSISPGLQMRLKALHDLTAKLPLVDIEGEVPEIGYDTETSIRSGVVIGLVAEIEGRINAFLEKYPSLLVFLTGGDIFNFDNKIKNRIFADKYIVPKGLNRILEYNNELL